MNFKTASQLKIDVAQYGQLKTVEMIRTEIAEKIDNEARQGGSQIEYFNPISVNPMFLDTVVDELNSLGYRVDIKVSSNYRLLLISW
ncbi:hypothetical protein [uncultured Acinetobacter sp.]|uniref:hypothetical protein n=1 Tax=uncultured Acinetobacter sp. TaxID=165433 RepID=UPI00258B16D7|nr:hypothetical protein [uncultured Acinetobacter sp.]